METDDKRFFLVQFIPSPSVLYPPPLLFCNINPNIYLPSNMSDLYIKLTKGIEERFKPEADVVPKLNNGVRQIIFW